MSEIASAGSAADGNASLKTRPPKAAEFRGLGILPNKRF